MPLSHHYLYREQLTSLHHGHALWEPDPQNLYEQVSIGDVGYMQEGSFRRMFNVLLEWDDPLNRTTVKPEPYPRLDVGPFPNIRRSPFSKGDYHPRHVTSHGMDGSPYKTYVCKRRQGALLTTPQDGVREDVLRTKAFEDYIRDYAESWFSVAQRHNLDVRHMEDLILVTGCTLVPSWGVAAFVDDTVDAETSMTCQTFPDGEAKIAWHETLPGAGVYQNSCQGSGDLRNNQCVFIRGFRAKRVLSQIGFQSTARPLPEDPDRIREDDMQMTQTPDVPNYRDPLMGVLDYIAEVGVLVFFP
ncbi:hypothetical protein BC826DRAFT_274337 [Russula brevipes]|nr:hypothetical protein BC826DRAFT_274337 [Russula brevipes]